MSRTRGDDEQNRGCRNCPTPRVGDSCHCRRLQISARYRRKRAIGRCSRRHRRVGALLVESGGGLLLPSEIGSPPVPQRDYFRGSSVYQGRASVFEGSEGHHTGLESGKRDVKV